MLEELFPSEDFPEWLHLHWGVDGLYKVFAAGGETAAVRAIYTDWLYAAAIRAELSRLGADFPRSPAEAHDVLRRPPPIHSDQFVARPSDDEAAGRVYRVLVSRRFGHLLEVGSGD